MNHAPAKTLIPLMSLALAGCDLTMTKQPKYGPQVAAALFANGTSAQTPPDGVVSQATGAEMAASSSPPPVSLALLQRGADRHVVFCKPCHGVSGDGDGVIVSRGFPRPPSYQDARVRTATAEQLFDAIGRGYGIMYPFADRIAPADRWALVAYIRALELAHDEGAPDVKPPPGSKGGPA